MRDGAAHRKDDVLDVLVGELRRQRQREGAVGSPLPWPLYGPRRGTREIIPHVQLPFAPFLRTLDHAWTPPSSHLQ